MPKGKNAGRVISRCIPSRRGTTITEENAKLRAERDRLNVINKNCMDSLLDQMEIVSNNLDLMSERDALRAALEEIAGFPEPKFAHEGTYESVWNIARNATGGKG